jgi:hypothetical protein
MILRMRAEGGRPDGWKVLRRRLSSWRREWVPRLSNARDRSAVTAVFLTFAVVGAPLSSVVRRACDQCPPTCPMHRTKEPQKHRPSCHSASPEGNGQASDASSRPRFGRPPCSNHGVLPGVAMAPMVLPDSLRARFLPVTSAAPSWAEVDPARPAEPPDTPPPISLV